MSEPKMVSERDVIKREREAFADGATWERCLKVPPTLLNVVEEARRRFPLPKVTRPRVMTDPHDGRGTSWRVVAFDIQVRFSFGVHRDEWRTAPVGIPVTRQRVQMWADLLARPTEVAEDDS